MNEFRLFVIIRGAVQGVGFRPFIFRLATELGLKGWVSNNAQGVVIEAEGAEDALKAFLVRINQEKPPRSFIQSLEPSFLDPVGHGPFEIRESQGGDKTALILPDIAVCPDCLREILDPQNRRYLYPFTNCTRCGPRYSIMEALPYDRRNTTMRIFAMCPQCQAEYEDPHDRRFHAQPNACPVCGPHVELRDEERRLLSIRQDAMQQAATALKNGQAVAVKGLGGFHLLVDARNTEAVQRLRRRKHREEKPLALMAPSLEHVKQDCSVSALEERLLCSPECPIVLLKKKPESLVADDVAPGNPYLGVMLAYTPLHVLLLRLFGAMVVATSANLGEEPMCIDDDEAFRRLKGIADLFLCHNRPVARQVDDSIVRIMAGRESVLRRARGYAPLPVTVRGITGAALAVGAHLKNSVAVSVGSNVFVSQHIGDLENELSFMAFQRAVEDLKSFYGLALTRVACDLHPGYASTKFARALGIPVTAVQHHHAHVLSCMAENDVSGPVLGVSWDGTGYGLDGTVWGGEFLVVDNSGFRRVARFQTVPLLGGEAAVREPRRCAIGRLYQEFGESLWAMKHLPCFKGFSDREIANFAVMLRKDLSCPRTSSVGRMFDAVASLVGLCQKARFEGQAAMRLEFAVEAFCRETYAFSLTGDSEACCDIIRGPALGEIIEDIARGASVGRIAAKFHNTLAEVMVAAAKKNGLKSVVLSGGCFQNKYLTERAILRLREEGFQVYWHQRVPPNDGGIALGQIAAMR